MKEAGRILQLFSLIFRTSILEIGQILKTPT